MNRATAVRLGSVLTPAVLCGWVLSATAQAPQPNVVIVQVCQAAMQAAPVHGCGAAVAGVDVQLNDHDSQVVQNGHVRTNGKGQARIEQVPDGQFTLLVYGQGWKVASQSLKLAGGKTSLVVPLQPLQQERPGHAEPGDSDATALGDRPNPAGRSGPGLN